METKNSDDSVSSNQSWNKTNERFISFGCMETQKMCDMMKLN